MPEDISVVGIDDIALSRLTRPKLTTVATPTAAAGRAAVDMLLQHGDDRRTTAQVTLQTELVIRDSTGPGPASALRTGHAARPPGDAVAVLRSRSERHAPRQHPDGGRARPRATTVPVTTRRRLLAAALAAAACALGAAACGDDDERPATRTGQVELSVFWWGGEAAPSSPRRRSTLYTKKHPNVTFKKTWQANQGYFDKLATLTAGGNAPDIFQIDDNYLTEYADRNVTLDLTKYVKATASSTPSEVPGEPRRSTAWSTASSPASPLGENTQGLVYNKTAAEQVRAARSRQTGWTWEELIAWAEQRQPEDRRQGARAPWTRAPTTRRSGSGCASRARTSTTASTRLHRGRT